MRLSISLFGPFRASLDGQEITGFKSHRVRALLAYLVVEADRAHSRDTLAALLWPDWPDQEAHNNLRYALYNLRQAIQDNLADPPFLVIGRETVQINPASDFFLDVRKFNQLLLEDKSQPLSPERFLEALRLYQGEFMEGFALPESLEFDEWATLKRAELQRILVEALGKTADTFEAKGDFAQALVYARRQVELEPWQEKGRRQIMRLLACSGERSSAIVYYERYRQKLSQELKVVPDAETQKLFLQIQDSTKGLELVHPAGPKKPPQVIGACPYRGLSAFREQDAPFFYGRAGFVDHMQQTLQEQPLVVVLIGPSGSGKSSLIYAGLIPPIRGQKNWLVIDFRPGPQPFYALAAALLPWLDPTLSETDRLVETQKLGEAILRKEESIQQWRNGS